jgi:sulfur carrier protein ThiS
MGVELTTIDHPLRRTERTTHNLVIPEKTTLGELVAKYSPPNVPMRVFLNGKPILADLWDTIYLANGDFVTIVPELHGGGDAKAILRAILMIAVTVAAFWVGGPAVLGLTGAWLGAFVGGVSLVGGLLVNALLPSQVDTPRIADNMNSQAYGWSPQNTETQGIVVPKFYGKHKLYGNIITSYLESQGSDQYLRFIVCVGMGPYKKLTDLKINDQPIKHFGDVEVETRLGHMSQDKMANFATTKVYYPASTKIGQDDNYIYTTTGNDFDILEIDLSFPQGLWHTNSEGYFEAVSVDLQVKVRKVGDTTWIPITHRKTSVEGNKIWVSSYRWSLGQWVDWQIDDTQERKLNDKIWKEVVQGESSWGYSPHGWSDEEIPYHTEGEPGASPNEDCIWRWMGEEYIWAPPTEPVYVDYMTVKNKTVKPIRKTLKYRVPDTAHGQYQVLINRLTEDNGGTKWGDDLYFAGVREVETTSFQYPRHVLVGIKAKATDKLSGSLRFSCIGHCSVVQVWTGTAWQLRWSNNPAWVAYDILTQPVIDGDGTATNPYTISRFDGMDPARIDLAKVKEWADWCDELVSDGNGGTEKRITFNGGFDYDSTVWECLLKVCQIGSAVPVWNGIDLTFAIDKEDDPVFLFSAGNIEESKFAEHFLPMEERATEIDADFINANTNYERDKLTIYQPDVANNGYRATLDCFGVTKESEVWRLAMRRLMANKYLTRTIDIDVDIEALNATIGDVGYVQHEVPQWGAGGRVVSATSSTITLDREVTIDYGTTYKILVRSASDVIQERTISDGPGTYTTLTVSTPWTTNPAQYDVYAFGPMATVAKLFRIIGLKRAMDQKFTVNLIEYRPEIYQYEASVPNYHSRLNQLLLSLQPKDVSVWEWDVMEADGRKSKQINIQFVPSDDAEYSYCEIWYKEGNARAKSDWLYAGSTSGTTFQIPDCAAKTRYTVALIPVTTTHEKLYIGYANTYEIRTTDYRDFFTFRQDSPPTEGMFAGDRWVDTNDSNKWYWFDGSAWVEIIVPQIVGLATKQTGSTYYGQDCEIIWDEPIFPPDDGTAPPYDYIRNYKVVVRDSSDTILRSENVTDERYVYTYDRNLSDAGTTQSTIKFQVWARDSFKILSTAPAELTVTLNAPPSVTNLRVNTSDGYYHGRNCEIIWDAPFSSSFKKSRFSHYHIEIKTTSGDDPPNGARARNGKDESFVYTYEQNEKDFGSTPAASFKVLVSVVDVFGNVGTPATLTVSRLSPPTVTNLRIDSDDGKYHARDCAVVWDHAFSGNFKRSEFSHYHVEIKTTSGDDPPNGSRYRDRKTESFTYSLDLNEKDFGDPPAASFKVLVSVVDIFGVSGTAAELLVETVVPPSVTNLHVLGGTNTFDTKNLHMRWDNIVSTSFKDSKFHHYEVRIRNVAGDLLFSESNGKRENYELTYGKNAEIFGTPTGHFKFGVVVYDKHHVPSIETILEVYSAAPPTVTGLQVVGGGTTFTGRNCNVEWDNMISSTFRADQLRYYQIRIRDIYGVLKRAHRTSDKLEYTYYHTWNLNDFGAYTRSFKIELSIVDWYGTEGTPVTITVDNSIPSMAAYALTLTPKKNNLKVSWANYADVAPSDIKKYVVYADSTNPPTTRVGQVAGDVDHFYLKEDVTSSQTWYVKVVPHDIYGAGTASPVASNSIQAIVADDIAETSTRKWAGESGADVTKENISAENLCTTGHVGSSTSTGGAFWTEILYSDGQITKVIDKGITPGQTVSFQAYGMVSGSIADGMLRARIYWEKNVGGSPVEIGGSSYLSWTEKSYTRKVLENIVIPEDDGGTPTPIPVSRIRISFYYYSPTGTYTGTVAKKRVKVETGKQATLYSKSSISDIKAYQLANEMTVETTGAIKASSDSAVLDDFGFTVTTPSLIESNARAYTFRKPGDAAASADGGLFSTYGTSNRTLTLKTNVFTGETAVLNVHCNSGTGSTLEIKAVDDGGASHDCRITLTSGTANITISGKTCYITSDTSLQYRSKMILDANGNMVLGAASVSSTGNNSLRLVTGTAPGSSGTGACTLYSAAYNSDNVPTFLTSNGNVLRLFKGAAITAISGTTSYASLLNGYGFTTDAKFQSHISWINSIQTTVNEIKARLEAMGVA